MVRIAGMTSVTKMNSSAGSEEDDGPRAAVDARPAAWQSGFVVSPKRAPSSAGRHGRGDDRLDHRAGAELGAAPAAEQEADGAADQHAR